MLLIVLGGLGYIKYQQIQQGMAMMAAGAGAVSRNNIGLVITVGLSIGTLFTLFVVPVMYSLIAEDFDEVAILS